MKKFIIKCIFLLSYSTPLNVVNNTSAIYVEENTTTIPTINGTKDLSPIVIPANVDKSLIKYESADERIATVDENGVITGVSDGTTTITVSSLNGVSVTTEVIVGGAIDTSIEITNGNVEIDIDSSLQLYTEILPLNVVDKNVVWESSDESVVKVSGYGKVTGVGIGEATITATSASGNTASIKVVVKHPAVSSIFLYSSFSTMYVGEEKKIEMITVNPTGYQTVLYVTLALYVVALLLSMFFVQKSKNTGEVPEH